MMRTVPASLGSDFTMRRDDLYFRWLITPTADFTITLPNMDPVDQLVIVNIDGAHVITVKDAGASTVATLSTAGQKAEFAVGATGTPVEEA